MEGQAGLAAHHCKEVDLVVRMGKKIATSTFHDGRPWWLWQPNLACRSWARSGREPGLGFCGWSFSKGVRGTSFQSDGRGQLPEVVWTEEPTTRTKDGADHFEDISAARLDASSHVMRSGERDRLYGKRRGERRRSANVVAWERVACQRPSGYGGEGRNVPVREKSHSSAHPQKVEICFTSQTGGMHRWKLHGGRRGHSFPAWTSGAQRRHLPTLFVFDYVVFLWQQLVAIVVDLLPADPPTCRWGRMPSPFENTFATPLTTAVLASRFGQHQVPSQDVHTVTSASGRAIVFWLAFVMLLRRPLTSSMMVLLLARCAGCAVSCRFDYSTGVPRVVKRHS